MEAQTYRVKTMREALELIREELGPEASVLHSRRVRQSSLGGWLVGQSELEVVASASVPVTSRFPQEGRQWLTQGATTQEHQSTAADDRSAVGNEQSQVKDSFAGDDAVAGDELRKLEPSDDPDLPLRVARLLAEAIDHLTQVGFDREQAQEAIQYLRDDGAPLENWELSRILGESLVEIAGMVPEAESIQWQEGMSHWVCLLGSHGAACSTVAQQLANGLAAGKGLSVAVARLGKQQTTKIDESTVTHATISQYEFASPESVEAKADELAENYDVVIFEYEAPLELEATAVAVKQLVAPWLQAIKPDEILGVLQSTVSNREVRDALTTWETIHPQGWVATELDQAREWPKLWAEFERQDLPLNYVSFGPGLGRDENEPLDLAKATQARMVSTLVDKFESTSRLKVTYDYSDDLSAASGSTTTERSQRVSS